MASYEFHTFIHPKFCPRSSAKRTPNKLFALSNRRQIDVNMASIDMVNLCESNKAAITQSDEPSCHVSVWDLIHVSASKIKRTYLIDSDNDMDCSNLILTGME